MRFAGIVSAAAAAGFAFALLAGPAVSAAAKRPPNTVLIAAAKKAALEKFEVIEEIRGLTIEAWLKKLFPGRAIVWRGAVCRVKAGDAASVDSPICVEALVRFEKGVVFTLGVGFDDQVAKPQDKPNSIWGSIAIRGKHCDFYRHPDPIQQAPQAIADIVKSGRCR
jgi:hypothetical protein